MATSQILQPGYVISDRYRVVRQLGEGGMGQVYLVLHTKTDERFALKILNPAMADTPVARERFRREARTPARIDSDHVARVVDSDIAEDLGDAPFLVMEYLRGENLQELSEQLGPLPPAEVLTYLRHVAIALDKAHAIGIVHRDLKPENLFLTTRDDGSPCVKVLDFGIAKLSGATGDLAKVKATSTGDVFGTPLFMSPEQCKSESDKIDHRSDLWAMGLIAHRLLTGDDFWTANTLTHLVAQIAYEPLKKPSERGAHFGPAYDAWFAKCCARDIEDRYSSAAEVVAELQAALDVPLAAASSPGAMTAFDKAREAGVSHSGQQLALKETSEALTLDRMVAPRRPRRGWMVALAALAGALLVVGLGVLVFRGGDESPSAAAEPAASATAQRIEPRLVPSAAPTQPPAAVDSASVAASSASATATASATAAPVATSFPPHTVPPPGPTTAVPSKPVAPPPVATATAAPTANPLDRRH